MNQPEKMIARMSALATLAACAAVVAWQAHAEPSRITSPKLDELVDYTTVMRGNVIGHKDGR